VNKNEVADTLKERDMFRCKGANILKLLKRLKQKQLNEKVIVVQARNFKMTYDMPQ
jgi:hypothetical protein